MISTFPNWTPIPVETGQLFRRKLIIDSGGKLDSFQTPAGTLRAKSDAGFPELGAIFQSCSFEALDLTS